jgi:fatty acid synthase, animal type
VKNSKSVKSSTTRLSNIIVITFRAGVLAKNGISQPFDKDASGYVRAEACSVAFLQKAKDAKRVYAEIINCKTNNDGFKKEGPMVPSVEVQKKLYENVYKNIEIDPTRISYIEAHATSTQVGDKKEVSSIDEFFCKNRTEPLKVGSVKSNIGHAEGAAGMSSIAKTILIFENDKLIPNLNLNTLRDDCPALVEQRIKVVTEVEKFKGDYIGVNSFGVLGANAHVLLKQNMKKKVNGGLPEDDFPRLVLWSGRSDEALNTIFDDILERPLDDEYIALLQNAQLEASPASVVRGYGIFAKNENGEITSCINRSTNTFKETKRPVAFVYSGVGSQWLGMGRDLMKIPIIADAVETCHIILATKGLNLKEIITSSDPKTFTNTLHTFVGVAAIQIGLTDLLKTLNIAPDFIIGHSVGELGCAYADETLSLEEMILSAYSRGMAINEVEREIGAMAAIGLGFKELRNIIPKGIEIACHNSKESCTVSGARESIKAFVQEAKEKKLLAKEIDSCGIAFHSSYIAASGPILLEKLTKIIKKKKKRSSKWISTSTAKENLEKLESSFSSADYHTNNLLSPVLFEEGISMLPNDVLMIEIAPHALLQPILKRSVVNGIYIGLTKRDVEDGAVFLLQALGR